MVSRDTISSQEVLESISIDVSPSDEVSNLERVKEIKGDFQPVGKIYTISMGRSSQQPNSKCKNQNLPINKLMEALSKALEMIENILQTCRSCYGENDREYTKAIVKELKKAILLLGLLEEMVPGSRIQPQAQKNIHKFS